MESNVSLQDKAITNLSEIRELKALFLNKYKENSKLYEEKKKEFELRKQSYSPQTYEQKLLEIATLEINAQVAMYVYNALYECRVFSDFVKARKLMKESVSNFGASYNEALDIYKGRVESLSTEEINDISTKLFFNRGRFLELKGAIITVTEALDSVKGKLMSNPIIYTKMDINENIRKYLDALNSNVYSEKLELRKTDPNNKEKYQMHLNNVIVLEEQRESTVASIIDSTDEAHFMLGDVRRAEDSALNALGVTRKPPYTLDLRTFKNRLDQLNIMLADLKFNKAKSNTSHVLHKGDNKFDSVTLSRDIVRLTNERKDILVSVLGENSPVLKTLNELVAGEGLYNIDGGYHAFKKQSGDIGDSGRSREVYVQGRNSILEQQMIIEEALRTEFEKKGTIEIISISPTYETEKEKKNLAYQKLFSDIIRYKKGRAARDARDAANGKELLDKNRRNIAQTEESFGKSVKADVGLSLVDPIEERLM